MIRLESIDVKGVSDAGPFSGTLPLSPGLQVISAHNSYGKSLAADDDRVWCFGAEPLLGQDNDPACFPLAARDGRSSLKGARLRSSHPSAASNWLTPMDVDCACLVTSKGT